jgi:hypothetical protein
MPFSSFLSTSYQKVKAHTEWVLAQLVRFLVVELIHLDLNFRFNMNIVFTTNYFFSMR